MEKADHNLCATRLAFISLTVSFRQPSAVDVVPANGIRCMNSNYGSSTGRLIRFKNIAGPVDIPSDQLN